MQTTPKGLRLHIGMVGRTNVGKSSVLNAICGQQAAITSPEPGTTTDVVEKSMELLPLGPVVFLDTAGLDDVSALARQRIEQTHRIFSRADIICLVAEPNVWGEFEEDVVGRCRRQALPLIALINKIDTATPAQEFMSSLQQKTAAQVLFSAVSPEHRDEYISELKAALLRVCPEDFRQPPPLIRDLLRAGETLVMVVPIDLQAPQGRLILPQVQTIREALDADALTLTVKEREYRHALTQLKTPPALAVCDSQIVLKMVADTPPEIKCTTFSILFSRYKGDLLEAVTGACAISRLRPADTVLIAESCSHHALEDDIGRVKIPRWLRQYTGIDLAFEVRSGRDFPEDLTKYRLIVQCGGCMSSRREMRSRISRAKEQGVPITNYGVCISYVQGVLQRVLSPFPAALEIYERRAG